MQQRTVGGLSMSALTLGCNSFGERTPEAQADRLVAKALEVGIVSFDTAAHYGQGESERILGKRLSHRRQQVVISSKCGLTLNASGEMKPAPGRGRREFIIAQCEASLKRLRTDWIDIYFMHRYDPDTPLDETLEAFNRLIDDGKIRFAGVGNVPLTVLHELAKIASQRRISPFSAAQYECSLLHREVEKEILPALATHHMALMPYFPLAGGLLSGKYRHDAPPPPGSRFATVRRHATRFLTEDNWSMLTRLQQLAAESGTSTLDYAFAWLLRQPQLLSVICGASTPEQIEINAKASAYILSQKEINVLHQWRR